ncbi:ABC transporter [Clavibacter sp. km1a]|uniref:ABC transporter n=1 Tax=Clavibacter sp. km1a TaxID=3459136 RepID=UPI0040411FE6
MRSRIPTIPLLAGLALALTACSAGPADAPAEDPSAEATGEGHGAVTGAAELAEPRLGLTSIDPEGQVTHLDLLDESVADLGSIGAPTAVDTDGRYLFAQTDAGVEIVDSGVWTWDHVDHFHYYQADPRLLGTVEGDGPATIATTNLSTTGGTGLFFPGSGEAVLLDTEALSKGEVTELFRLDGEPGPGLVVPVGSLALVTEGQGADATVVGVTRDGERTGLVEACPDPAGTITTRVGAVIGCGDGALLASVDGEELSVERIPYPEGTTAPAATSFDNREGRPTVAGLAGDQGVWMLDTRARSWSLLPAPAPLVHVTAVDDADDILLALTADGRVLVMSAADGAVVADSGPLVADSLAAGRIPTLVADQQRAYLAGPVERRLHEIDFADGARVSRTFDTATEPAFTAETGR